MIGGYSPRSCVVFTTPERFNLFSSVLGEDVDVRFEPELSRPLDAVLETVALSGGRTVVLDEAHFYQVQDMLEGLDRYLGSSLARSHDMRFIVVCSRRVADDAVLAHLAMYCGIYDLVYGVQGADVSVAIERLIDEPNGRQDVLDVLDASVWRLSCQPAAKRAGSR